LIILCSPCNPSGAVYSAEELEALAGIVINHEEVFVISDEICEHISYVGKHASIAAVPGMRVH
jgi:aspartate aminotransferase